MEDLISYARARHGIFTFDDARGRVIEVDEIERVGG
jgi:hypothetical protein